MSSGCNLLLLILLLACSACNVRSNEAATTGAFPPMTAAVGPVPGPGVAPPAMTNPYANDSTVLPAGRQLFVWYNCSGCHGGHGGGGMGPSLRDVDWIYGNADAQIFSSISEGRANGMPAWGTKVPETQIWKLVAYIKSMRTSLEPEAPVP